MYIFKIRGVGFGILDFPTLPGNEKFSVYQDAGEKSSQHLHRFQRQCCMRANDGHANPAGNASFVQRHRWLPVQGPQCNPRLSHWLLSSISLVAYEFCPGAPSTEKIE